MDPLGQRPSERVGPVCVDSPYLTYRELIRRADEFGRFMFRDRKCIVAWLAHCVLGMVIPYVAALRHRHGAAWFGPVRKLEWQADLGGRFAADVEMATSPAIKQAFGGLSYLLHENGSADITVTCRGERPSHHVPEDTSVSLLASETMSRWRAVEFTVTAVSANPRAITTTLGIGPDRRAATSLPLFYFCGVSVLNSRLVSGRRLLLTGAPAIRDRVWQAFAAAGCDSFAALPVHLECPSCSALSSDRIAALRAASAARAQILGPVVRRMLCKVEAAGFRFHKRHGQTQDTVRMSILLHEHSVQYPDSAGRALAHGSVVITNEEGVELPGPCGNHRRPDAALHELSLGQDIVYHDDSNIEYLCAVRLLSAPEFVSVFETLTAWNDLVLPEPCGLVHSQAFRERRASLEPAGFTAASRTAERAGTSKRFVRLRTDTFLADPVMRGISQSSGPGIGRIAAQGNLTDAAPTRTICGSPDRRVQTYRRENDARFIPPPASPSGVSSLT